MHLRICTIVTAWMVLALYGSLLVALGWFLKPETIQHFLTSERTLFSIRLSLLAATLAAGSAVVLAMPAAYALSRYRFAGRQVIETILEMPLVVSPAALGAMLLIFFNHPVGEWIQTHWFQLVFTFAGVVLAQFLTVLGIAVRLIKTAFDNVPAELETVARSLGASPSYAWFTITLPLAWRGILAAFILSWAKALGEFGATIMIAGTMAMRTETLPIAIFLRLATADLEGTAALIVVLVGLGLSALYLARQVAGKSLHA
ncbi:MAG: ABC transporter permease subunit [Verrucomicrobiota bacterium]|nr:ABC transporter permease subunit [Limisphaera sp.]MDW8380612.1 ABC transporter permease subunit [Verrucomicrobiota bacterium]